MTVIDNVILPGTPASHVLSVPVLSVEGIMAKYNLQVNDLEKMSKELDDMKLLDILFSYPDGPEHDIALFLVATSG